MPVGLVVLRAADPGSSPYLLPGFEVDVSPDGADWLPLAQQVQVFDNRPGAEELVPQPGLVARYVRVVASGPPSYGLNGLTELSVWRGRPPVRATAQPLSPGRPPLGAPSAVARSRGWWRVAAVALAAVLLLSVVVALLLSRRRRTFSG